LSAASLFLYTSIEKALLQRHEKRSSDGPFFCLQAADAGDVLPGVESNREKMEGNGTMMELLRRVTGALGVAALCWTTGCAGFWVAVGSSSSSSTSGDIVYVANGTTETVSGFVVGTGALTAVTGSPVSLGFSPTALAVNPADSILFVAGSSQIAAYSIGTSGVLSSLSSGVTSGLTDVVAMDVSPDGQWLLAVDGTLASNAVTVYEFLIDSSTGGLTQEGGAYISITGATPTPNPSAIKVSPNGEFVFVALGTGGDLSIPFTTSSGTMSTPSQMMLTSSQAYPSDNALAVNAGSTILYIARSFSTSAGAIASYSIGSNGVLAPVAQSSTGVQPNAVVLNAAGTGVYVANRGSTTSPGNTITEFSTTTGGGLTLLGTIASGSLPIGLAVDNSGDYLLAAANGGSSDLTMYSYDSTTTGKLDLSAATATGTDPTGPVAIATTH
jgi:6-phosphogluconolactonase (cycloisomerase 2 family)